jgi:deoxyribose-phosphate aldolase
MYSSADFVKTSTGKGTSGATLEGAEEMLITINDYVKICKEEVGFKAAGGIRKPEEALEYARLAQKIMGEQFIKKETFRIGASSLTEGLFSLLTF